MFDSISFINISVDQNAISDAEQAKKKIINDNSRHAAKAGVATVLSTEPLNADFCFDGSARYLIPVPMTGEAKKRFLYLQAFAWMQMGAGYFTRRNFYQSYLVVYTYSGSGKLEYDGKTYTVTAGDGFWVDCRKPCYYYTDGDMWNHSDLHFWGGNSDYFYAEFTRTNPVCFHTPASKGFQQLLERVLGAHCGTSHFREMEVSNRLERLLLHILSSEDTNSLSRVPEMIRLLRAYLEQHFIEQITLDQLSSQFAISKFHMSREFKKYIGFSPIEYLTELRVEYAKDLLVNTSLSAYKIADLSGIPNEANFIRIFKAHEGCTPGEYRKRVRIDSGY